MKTTSLLRTSAAALALAAAAQANASAILQVTNGILTGAKNVSVQGTLYDVTFVDGTCLSVFGGCDAAGDFAFNTSAGAVAAGNALLTQVFIDSALGNFDSSPSKIAGCTALASCYSYIPYSSVNAADFALTYVQNASGANDGVYSTINRKTLDLANTPQYNFARFQVAAVDVPEPGSIALVGLGLAGMAFARRRKA